MNREVVRNFVVGMVVLLLAVMLFVAAESKGSALESRLGLLGFASIAALAFLAIVLGLNKPTVPSKEETTNSTPKKPKVH